MVLVLKLEIVAKMAIGTCKRVCGGIQDQNTVLEDCHFRRWEDPAYSAYGFLMFCDTVLFIYC